MPAMPKIVIIFKLITASLTLERPHLGSQGGDRLRWHLPDMVTGGITAAAAPFVGRAWLLPMCVYKQM